MMQYIGPVVIKQEMSPDPFTIFTNDYPFNIGQAYSLRDGKDATIIATGYMVTEAIKAVDLLEKDGLDVGVLNVSTLKPIDEEAIIAAAERTGAIVTAENSSDINGLGDAVACALCENLPTPLVKVGVEDEFGQSGLVTDEKDELQEHFALAAEDVADAVKKCIKKKEALR
jgi:transketolase